MFKIIENFGLFLRGLFSAPCISAVHSCRPYDVILTYYAHPSILSYMMTHDVYLLFTAAGNATLIMVLCSIGAVLVIGAVAAALVYFFFFRQHHEE